VTATFYLTGVGLEGGAFWWQSLQAAIDRAADLTAVATEFELPAHPPTALTAGIEALSPARRRLLAARLEALAGPDPNRRALDASEIRRLAGLGFAIGFHTRGHDRLTGLSDDELAAALQDGREALETAAGVPLATVAYPHGDADERVARAAAAANFELGFVTAMTAVSPADDPHRLARPEILAPTTARFALDLARLYASERRARTVSSSS
jgi:peptidoglycan/xylan/chitin deacetylase (PgdA/CDA1 family)